MSFLFLAGSKLNQFARGGTVSVSPAESAVAPKAGLYDLDPGTPHMAGSLAADSYMRVQLNLVTNGGFETAALSGWTDESVSGGTIADTTTAGEFRSGTHGCEMTVGFGTGDAVAAQDITVNAGESIKISAWAKLSGAGLTAYVGVRNKKTGKYYNGATNAWEAGAVFIGSSTSTSFAEITETLTVESFDDCRSDTVVLHLTLVLNGGGVTPGSGWWDDVAVLPGVSFASIHGHNYGNVISPLVQSSDDGSAWTTRATMTIKRPAFFSTFAIIYAEYWQIKLSGTNHEIPYTGEAVLGQYQTSTTSPKWGLPKTRTFPGVRTRGPSARMHVYNYSTDPPQDIEGTFSPRTSAALKELCESLWLRSGQGLYPVIVVPIDTEADVYFGHLAEPWTEERPFQGVWETTLKVTGAPFPTIGL